MLSEKLLSEKQQAAVDRLYENYATVLIAPTGAGKTVICLTAVNELIAAGALKRAIVACPAKVVDVWPKEAAKWAHLQELRVSPLKGSKGRRLSLLMDAWEQGSDVLVVSLNNLDWLLQQDHGADGIIIDELSKAAGKQTAKLKHKKYAANLNWRVGMTATPVSQDFEKLQKMTRIVDDGKALGRNHQRYLETYFYSDYMGYNWTLRDGAAEQIMAQVSPLIHAVEDTKEDELPPLTHETIRFKMPAETRETYDEMRRHMVVGEVEAANEAVKSGKLRQIASGFLYEDGEAHYLDGARVNAAAKWCDSLAGKPGLIFYEYVEQGNRLSNFVGRNIKLAQVQSMSHGVDGLQHDYADVLFYHPVWSRDAAEQAVGRVWRTGQTKPVTVTTLVCDDTLDDLVLSRVEDRGEFMKLFIKHLKQEK